MLAATAGGAELVRELLRVGADASSKYKSSGETALMLAKRNGHNEIAQMLEQAGTNE